MIVSFNRNKNRLFNNVSSYLRNMDISSNFQVAATIPQNAINYTKIILLASKQSARLWRRMETSIVKLVQEDAGSAQEVGGAFIDQYLFQEKEEP